MDKGVKEFLGDIQTSITLKVVPGERRVQAKLSEFAISVSRFLVIAGMKMQLATFTFFNRLDNFFGVTMRNNSEQQGRRKMAAMSTTQNISTGYRSGEKK